MHELESVIHHFEKVAQCNSESRFILTISGGVCITVLICSLIVITDIASPTNDSQTIVQLKFPSLKIDFLFLARTIEIIKCTRK